jgi:SAM-dependent methyltransferase
MAESDRIKWDRRYAGSGETALAPPDWLQEFDALLPRQGYALDIAAGAGRLALWLAGRGLDVLAVDISTAALELAWLEGFLLAEVATVANLERHAHPSLKYLAEPGELRQDSALLEIVHYQEGWHDDRASAQVVARK